MPLNLRQSRPRDDWRCRLLDGVLFVIAATALVWSLPIRTPWAGLDPGWAEALVQATDHGRIFGRDVVFTFGPYHQLYTRQISDNLNLFLLGRWLYGLGWGAVMLSVRRQVGHPLTWLWLLLLAVLTSQRLDALFNVFCLAVTLTALCRSQAESLAWPNYLCQLCSLLLGILIKLSFVALAAPAIAVLVATEWRQPFSYGLQKILKLLALPVLTVLLLGSGGMSLADGWHYIAGPNRDIVSGYSEAMALYSKTNNWQQLLYWLCSGAAIAIAAVGVKRRLQVHNPAVVSAFILGGLLFFWAPFKAGMVRHDPGHYPMAGLYLLSSGLLITMLFWRDLQIRKPWLALALCLPAAGGYWISTNALDLDLKLYKALRLRGLEQFWSASISARGREELRSHREGVIKQIQTRADVHEQLPIPTGSTADLLPWDTMDVISNGLTYTPRPIPHSLNAYSPQLLQLNRAFFTDPNRRPEYVILNRKVIDQRWPSIGLEGPALSEISRNYELAGQGSKGSLVMKERSQPQPSKEIIIFEETFDLSQQRSTSRPLALPNNLPAGSSISFLFKANWRYKLRKALYRPGFVVRAQVSFADGHQQNFRLVPNAARELPLMPIPFDEQDLLTYIEARQGKLTPKSIDAAATPREIRLQLRSTEKGHTPPLSDYFKQVGVVINKPMTISR
ncbi:MAG: hypothetical protein CBD29_02590 [Synechococcus sp. TMED169]|jgi:hypothetical protein|nr:MAG: hypothetical protein CBD29_02590 [Synechococcus sp. TMED169]